MFKRILERFRQDRGLHQATVRVDFFPQDQVAPQIFWHYSLDQESDTVPLVVFVYARILYELAELNETRVARELIEFLEQVCERVQASAGHAKRPRLPLGQLKLGAGPVGAPGRTCGGALKYGGQMGSPLPEILNSFENNIRDPILGMGRKKKIPRGQ